MKLRDLTTNAELALPNDLLWSDEFEWSPVAANNQYSLGGSLIIQQGVRLAGRPISLRPPEQDMAFVPRSTVQTLRDWAAIPGRKFRLTFEYPTDTREFVVVFAHAEDPISAEPAKGFPSHKAADWFRVSPKFIEVIP